MRLFLTNIFIVLFYAVALSGENAASLFELGNKAYANKDYEKAISYYEQVLEQQMSSADLYYNLGNAFFKTGEIPSAILFYERSLKLRPQDEDTKHNLKLAYEKTIDKIEVVPEVSLKKWYNSISSRYSERTWSILTIIAFSLACLSIFYFISGNNSFRRQLGFGSSILFLLVFFIFFAFARHQYYQLTTSSHAIVFEQSLTVKSAPNENGTKLFILHEGTKVALEKEVNGWVEIRLSNGDVGWVKNSSLRKI